jgi:multicomponent Na+:H+ antiporter subunit D
LDAPQTVLSLGAVRSGRIARLRLGMLIQVVDSGPIEYRMAGWPPPMGIVYYVDHLSGLVATIVASVAMVNLAGVYQGVRQEIRGKEGAFYALYLLSLTGLLGIVVTGDAFNLYVLLEIASLTGYALVGMGSPRAALSGLNYVIIGTVGACLYLLGVGYLYIMTGSLNMADIARLLPPLYDSPAILVAFVMALVGLWVKMAFFPLHAWLPNAYSHAPSPSASLMAPLMTKVMIYVMIRLVFTIFTWDYLLKSGILADLVVWLSVLAIVAGGFYALAERNLKRMLTYIIVAEVGYMVGGAFLGTKAGLTGAILHIVNDAAMTLCLFMAAGSLFYKTRSMEFDALKGVLKDHALEHGRADRGRAGGDRGAAHLRFFQQVVSGAGRAAGRALRLCGRPDFQQPY